MLFNLQDKYITSENKIQDNTEKLLQVNNEINYDDIPYELGEMLNDSRMDWQAFKRDTEPLAQAYKELNMPNKANRVRVCGSFLAFKYFNSVDEIKLNSANFCQTRLCPMCGKRRSMKMFYELNKVLFSAKDTGKYQFLFLTLTMRNVNADELPTALDELLYAFKKLGLKADFKHSVKGWYRALEITHETNPHKKAYGTYHPHLHVVLAVPKSYFQKDYYISQEKWTTMWQECLKVEYTPIVHIELFGKKKNQNLDKAIAEVSKYTVKSSDYIVKGKSSEKVNMVETKKAVFALDGAIANRRLSGYGGVLKEILKELKIGNAETDADLLHLGNENEMLEELQYVILVYRWNIGYGAYQLTDIKKSTP